MANPITIGGTSIKSPSSIDYKWYNVTEAERTADATMHLDFIAKKRTFALKYDILSHTEFNTIMGVINATTMFFAFTYYYGSSAQNITVYVGEISATPFKTDGEWKWKDVTFNLIQQ